MPDLTLIERVGDLKGKLRRGEITFQQFRDELDRLIPSE